MARKNFSKQTLTQRFTHCGGRCEGILTDDKRCNAVLVPGRWHGDHDNPDGLTGEPTFENCRCLCLPCHKLKTTKDVADIAQAKRRQAADIGVKTAATRPIQSAPFPKPERIINRQAKYGGKQREPANGMPGIARRFGIQ